VVPTKAATAPQLGEVTMAVKRATSKGSGVTSTNHPSPDRDIDSVVGGGSVAFGGSIGPPKRGVVALSLLGAGRDDREAGVRKLE
jgi:hypothetical protein